MTPLRWVLVVISVIIVGAPMLPTVFPNFSIKVFLQFCAAGAIMGVVLGVVQGLVEVNVKAFIADRKKKDK